MPIPKSTKLDLAKAPGLRLHECRCLGTSHCPLAVEEDESEDMMKMGALFNT